MDEYEYDLQLDDQDEVDVWEGESEVASSNMPQALWSDHDIGQQPPEPDAEVDRLADQVEASQHPGVMEKKFKDCSEA